MSDDDAHIAAHRHSIDHRDEILCSVACGCFYCLAIFPTAEIVHWADRGRTALCPKCGIDSVVGDASGYPVDLFFLGRMKRYWFQGDPGPASAS